MCVLTHSGMYCRDISKKIRAGYKQKQKQGIVIIPPMGYFKDKNTGEIIIIEEQADIVRRIFSMYVDGYGLKAIANTLNEEGIKSQGYYQQQLLGKKLGYNKPEIARRFLWENTGVKRVLQNEFYTGTLVCHQSYTNKINGVRKMLPPEEHYRHENFVPAIVSREIWEQAQFLLAQKVKKNVRASSGKPCHRYTGLLKCGDCGSSFSCRTRRWRDKPERYEYICNGYHRYGKDNCTSHRIDEAELDKIIFAELMEIKQSALKNYKAIEADVKRWKAQKNTAQKKQKELSAKLEQRKSEQQMILLERIRDREHASAYDKMLRRCDEDIKKLTKQLEDLQNIDETVKKRKAEMKEGLDLLDLIVADGAISNTHLRMLIDEITVTEINGKINLSIRLNADFRQHIDFHNDDGEMVDRAAECIAIPW